MIIKDTAIRTDTGELLVCQKVQTDGFSTLYIVDVQIDRGRQMSRSKH